MTIDLRRTSPPQELGYKSNDRVPVVYLDDISILFSGNLKHKELEVFDKLCEHIGFKIYNKGETKHLFLKEAVIELLIKKNLATYREKGEGRRVLELFIDEYTFFQYYLAICSKNKKNMDRGLAQWIVTVLANITLNMLLDHRLTNNNVFKPVLHERWFLIKVLPPLANIIGFFIQGAEWADLIPQTKEKRREAMDGLMSIQSNRIQPIIQILVNSINTNSSTSTNIDYFNDEFWNSKQNKNTTERLVENEF